MRTVIIENRDEINRIIRECKTCYLAISENNIPYVIPMNFALNGDTVIFHSAQSGRMWNALKSNPIACINWVLGEELAWQDIQIGCSYRVKSKSVIAEGEIEFIDDYNEKVKCLQLFMSQYSERKFKFNAPSVNNVGIFKVHIKLLCAKDFGAKAVTPWSK